MPKVSTLTQPTASSAAKSAPPRHLKTPPPINYSNNSVYQSRSAPSSGRLDHRTISRNQQHTVRSSQMSKSISHTSSTSNIKPTYGRQFSANDSVSANKSNSKYCVTIKKSS